VAYSPVVAVALPLCSRVAAGKVGAMSRAAAADAPVAPASPRQIRNVVLVGPAGVGKSMLYERLLQTDPAVAVKVGGQEPSTGLSVAAVARGDLTVNLLDTPGRPDFVGEVRAGLRAADAVIFVVSAGNSVDEATRMLWRECDAVGVPRAVVVTQLELARADYDAVVSDLQRTFGDAQPLYRPLLAGGAVEGVADLLGRTVRRVTDAGFGDPEDPGEAELADIEERRGAVLESVIEESEDESLLERYLEGEEIDAATLVEDLRKAIGTARFFPILPVHPPTCAGVEEVLSLIQDAFPSPDQAWVPPVTSPDGAALDQVAVDLGGPLVAQVVRTSTDPYVGRLSLVRVFSGTLRSDDRLHVSGHLERVVGHEVTGHPGHDEDDERVGQISLPLPGGGSEPRDHAVAGEIVQVTKLAHAETSDSLSDQGRPALVAPWLLPEPLLPVAIRAASPGDEDKLASALSRVVAEDVTVRLEQNPETHQLVLWALGPAHVEDLLHRLRERHHVEVETEEVRTSLRETFVRPVRAQGRLVKQSGGHGQYAVVQLEVEPLERGAGFEFVDKVVGGAVPRQFIPSVEKGLRSQLEQGVLAGYPVVDVRVTLVDGKAHSVDSSDMAFQTAAGLALREVANDSTVALLEPVDHIAVTVADEYVGPVMADLRGRRAQVHGTEAGEEGHTVVHAEVPQHELARYPIDLRSVSHGSGTFTREFVRYDYMPPQLAREVPTNTNHR
jgi:elongation factor G